MKTKCLEREMSKSSRNVCLGEPGYRSNGPWVLKQGNGLNLNKKLPEPPFNSVRVTPCTLAVHQGIVLWRFWTRPSKLSVDMLYPSLILLFLLFSHSVMSNSFTSPWTVACQAPLSMGFSRQEYWSGLPFPFQGIFLNQGSNPHLLHWQADSLPLILNICVSYTFSSLTPGLSTTLTPEL